MEIIQSLHGAFEKYRKEHPFGRAPLELYDPIDYIMNMGGKRLRPLLVLLAYRLFREEVAGALPIAMAVEVFHNFSLVHDDIMDEAPLRRGMPTVHFKYGQNAGILSGDAMLIQSYAFLCKAPRTESLSALLEAFNKVAIEVCEGQQYDINFESRQNVAIEEYLRMIELKTAALIGGSLELGAIAAGAPPEDIRRAASFGRKIGIAFQLQDDILDTFGDPGKVGKKAGGDIVQNKKTFLILKGLELARGGTQHQLAKLMSETPGDEAAKIETVTGILRELGIPALAENLKQRYQEEAFRYLSAINGADEVKEELQKMAMALMERES